jgi:hypothetical protein
MLKSDARRLTLRICFLFMLLACLTLMREEPTAAQSCNAQEAYDCIYRGAWISACCLCYDGSQPYEDCETGYQWDFCSNRCVPAPEGQ